MRNDFESFFNTINKFEIKEEWDKARDIKKKRSIITLSIIIIIDIIMIYVLIHYISFFEGKFSAMKLSVILFFLVIDTIIYSLATVGGVNIYANAFKEKIIDLLLKNFFDNVDYIPKKEMPSLIYNEGLYEGYDNYYSDDYMEADIDNKYRIKMANIETEKNVRSTDSDGNTTTHTQTVFSGLFAKINIGKSINNELRITPNIAFLRKNKLNMDSQEFEKYFDVISTNKIVGMQLLTHDIMAELINYRKDLNKPFDIYIKDSTMYIRLYVGDMFEAKMSRKSVVDKGIVEKYFYVVNIIYSLSKQMIRVVDETEI